MTARQFSAEIGVSAGTISNILGGRNNPSVELYVRILNRFRTINPQWLLLGTGSMYTMNAQQTALFGDMKPLDLPAEADDPSEMPKPAPAAMPVASRQAAPRQIARIIVYYTDGTYEER